MPVRIPALSLSSESFAKAWSRLLGPLPPQRIGFEHPTGQVLWLNLETTPLPEEEWLLTLSKHPLQEKPVQLDKELEHFGILTSAAAHDLGNVLGAILSLTTALRENKSIDSQLANGLDIITRACDRGRTLVRGLLDFSIKDTAEQIPINLNEVIEEALRLQENGVPRRITLSTQLDPELPLILGNPGALIHALMNLCINAIDAMPAGGLLKLQSRVLEDHILVSVEDTGIGMSQEVKKQVLNPYFTTKSPGKGTGLGLTNVHKTVQAHGGWLQIQSFPGCGTQITLHFPTSTSKRDGSKVTR